MQTIRLQDEFCGFQAMETRCWEMNLDFDLWRKIQAERDEKNKKEPVKALARASKSAISYDFYVLDGVRKTSPAFISFWEAIFVNERV